MPFESRQRWAAARGESSGPVPLGPETNAPRRSALGLPKPERRGLRRLLAGTGSAGRQSWGYGRTSPDSAGRGKPVQTLHAVSGANATGATQERQKKELGFLIRPRSGFSTTPGGEIPERMGPESAAMLLEQIRILFWLITVD